MPSSLPLSVFIWHLRGKNRPKRSEEKAKLWPWIQTSTIGTCRCCPTVCATTTVTTWNTDTSTTTAGYVDYQSLRRGLVWLLLSTLAGRLSWSVFKNTGGQYRPSLVMTSNYPSIKLWACSTHEVSAATLRTRVSWGKRAKNRPWYKSDRYPHDTLVKKVFFCEKLDKEFVELCHGKSLAPLNNI